MALVVSGGIVMHDCSAPRAAARRLYALNGEAVETAGMAVPCATLPQTVAPESPERIAARKLAERISATVRRGSRAKFAIRDCNLREFAFHLHDLLALYGSYNVSVKVSATVAVFSVKHIA